jgi:hypothetical protein
MAQKRGACHGPRRATRGARGVVLCTNGLARLRSAGNYGAKALFCKVVAKGTARGVLPRSASPAAPPEARVRTSGTAFASLGPHLVTSAGAPPRPPATREKPHEAAQPRRQPWPLQTRFRIFVLFQKPPCAPTTRWSRRGSGPAPAAPKAPSAPSRSSGWAPPSGRGWLWRSPPRPAATCARRSARRCASSATTGWAASASRPRSRPKARGPRRPRRKRASRRTSSRARPARPTPTRTAWGAASRPSTARAGRR